MKISADLAPRAAVSSVLGGDGALWVVDGAGGRLTLKRIDEQSGKTRVASLRILERARGAWLFALGDGSVALATTDGETHLISRLVWTADGLALTAQLRGEGGLAGAPYVSAGNLAVPVAVSTEEADGVEVQLVPATSLAPR